MDKYTEDAVRDDDEIYNRMILRKGSVQHRLTSFPKDISEDVIVALLFAKAEGCKHATKVFETLDVDDLDELAILEDFEGFTHEYLERQEHDHIERNL